MSEPTDFRVKPARGPIAEATEQGTPAMKEKEVTVGLARVGRKAPDFETNAFVNGVFKNIRLSDLFGKWIVLCFYPGDFTFV